MENQIVKINPSEYGISDNIAENIQQQFQPMLDKMVELENEFNNVIQLDVTDPKTSKIAKELRMKYVKVRTGTSEIHKTQKAFYLNGGRFVDGWKNAQLFASQGKEQKLEEIEKYHENIEKQRIAKIQAERIEMLRPFVRDVENLELASMTNDVWDAYLSAKKQQYFDIIEAEKKAESDRIAKEKADADERERIRIENEKLKKENELKEKQLADERAKQQALENELKAKKDAETKAEQERLERIEREKADAESLAKMPIKDQLNAWVDSFVIPDEPIVNHVSQSIIEKFELFRKWAKNEIKSL